MKNDLSKDCQQPRVSKGLSMFELRHRLYGKSALLPELATIIIIAFYEEIVNFHKNLISDFVFHSNFLYFYPTLLTNMSNVVRLMLSNGIRQTKNETFLRRKKG